MFLSDKPRWYNNGIFGEMGFAVPWWGNNPTTVNEQIAKFVNVIGLNVLGIMSMPDARMSRPPQRECLNSVAKMIYRGRDVLASRMVRFNQERTFQAGHVTPQPQAFLIHPAPYFTVKNEWLKEYGGIALMMMSEAMQHTNNDHPTEITEEFAFRMGEFLQRILVFIATELLDVGKEAATDPAFVIPDESWQNYNPLKKITVFESLDTPTRTDHLPTEDDLQLLVKGIPTVQFNMAHIQNWPLGPTELPTSNIATGAAAEGGEGTAAGTGTASSGSSFASNPN